MISISPLPQLSATKIRTGLTSFESLVDCLIKQYEQQASSGNLRPRRDPRWRTQRAVVAKSSKQTARTNGAPAARQKSTTVAAPKTRQSKASQRPMQADAATARTAPIAALATTALEQPLFGRIGTVSDKFAAANNVHVSAQPDKPALPSNPTHAVNDSTANDHRNHQVVQVSHCNLKPSALKPSALKRSALKPKTQRCSPAKVQSSRAQQALFQWYAD
jgi:hypothetical protein